MKSKSLQLQSNKSTKGAAKTLKTTKKNVLLLYVLYLFLGHVSGVVPLVAGWRETKLKCTIGLWDGEKTAVYDYFFSFFEQYQSEYHCYSKCLALFCLEALDSQRRLSLTPAGQSGPGGGGRGASAECLSSCGPLWCVERQPHSAALPPGLPLTLPRLGSSLDWPITALRRKHGISDWGVGRGPPPLDLCRRFCPLPRLSVLWHKDHFSWKM